MYFVKIKSQNQPLYGALTDDTTRTLKFETRDDAINEYQTQIKRAYNKQEYMRRHNSQDFWLCTVKFGEYIDECNDEIYKKAHYAYHPEMGAVSLEDGA